MLTYRLSVNVKSSLSSLETINRQACGADWSQFYLLIGWLTPWMKRIYCLVPLMRLVRIHWRGSRKTPNAFPVCGCQGRWKVVHERHSSFKRCYFFNKGRIRKLSQLVKKAIFVVSFGRVPYEVVKYERESCPFSVLRCEHMRLWISLRLCCKSRSTIYSIGLSCTFHLCTNNPRDKREVIENILLLGD